MGFAILWLASLSSGVILVAIAMAQGSRMREGRLATGLPFIAALVPFGLGAVATVIAQLLHTQGLRPSYLAYALSWTTASVIGAGCVIHFGSRRPSETVPMRAARWPRGIIAGALAGTVATYVVTLLVMDIDARCDLEEVRAEAIRLAESVAPAPVPDERNALPIYKRAFKLMGNWSDDREKFRWLARMTDRRTADVTTDEAAEFLREHAEVIRLLHEAAALPEYHLARRYVPIDFEGEISALTHFRNAANLLTLDARRKASDGDMRGGLRDVASGWAMARHITKAPTLIDCMIAVAADSTVTGSVQDVIALGTVRRADLAGFPLEPKLSFVDSHAKAWQMEAAMMLHTVAAPRVWEIKGARYGHRGGVHWRVFIAPGLVALMQEEVALARGVVSKPYYMSRERFDEIDDQVQEDYSVNTLLPFAQMPTVRPVLQGVAETEARHRLAVLGIAAACFRTEEGRYPDKLQELIPDYISAIPVDPFDGKPLRMSPEGDGLILYSVGMNGKDEGGRDESWSHGGTGGADISFRLGDAYTSALAKAKQPRRKRRGRRVPKPKSRN